GPRDRRQDQDLRLPLPVPGRGQHRQGRQRIRAHRREGMSARRCPTLQSRRRPPMKTSMLWLSALLVAGSLAAPAALAVDNVSSRDAPDLASVRAKIKAKDFKGAIAELTPMLTTNQHADVYNLMGFSLRKIGDTKQAYTFYRKALDFDPEHKGA